MKQNVILCGILLVALSACNNNGVLNNPETGDIVDKQSETGLSVLIREGVAFYLIKSSDLQTGLNTDSIVLEDGPFISSDEIIAYDSAAHIFELDTEAGSYFYGTGSLDGKYFVLMANDDTLYPGVVWSPIHSQSLSHLVLTLAIQDGLSENFIELISAYPSAKFANEQVNLNDGRLIDLLDSEGKIKTLVEEPAQDTGDQPAETDTLY